MKLKDSDTVYIEFFLAGLQSEVDGVLSVDNEAIVIADNESGKFNYHLHCGGCQHSPEISCSMNLVTVDNV